MDAGLAVVWALIGVACYRGANRFADRTGKTPWGWPALLWGLVGFLLGLIGALLLFIAEKTTTAPECGEVVWAADSRYGSGGPYMPAPPPQWAPPPPPPPGPPLGENFLPRR
jgi:hypothetical protein